MSVKISRREEKRDTSLRDFVLATTLPLLSGLIGYYTGRTGDINQDFEVYSNAIAAEQGKLRGRPDLSEAVMLPVINLFKELNQLTKVFSFTSGKCTASKPWANGK